MQSNVTFCKCGVLAETIVIEDEDLAQFETLRAGLEEQYAPRSRIQCELLDYIAGLFWRLARVPSFEAAIFDALRKEVAPDETDSAAEQERRQRLVTIAALYLKNIPRASSKEPEKEKNERRGLARERRDPPSATAGLILIRDSQTRDALGKLSRHEAALTKLLSRALQLLSLLQSQEQAGEDR